MTFFPLVIERNFHKYDSRPRRESKVKCQDIPVGCACTYNINYIRSKYSYIQKTEYILVSNNVYTTVRSVIASRVKSIIVAGRQYTTVHHYRYITDYYMAGINHVR